MIKKQLIILVLLFCCSSCSVFAKPMKIEYLLPEGFTGGVIILYNQPDSVTPAVSKDGTIRYYIPKNGFLKVNTNEPEEIYNYSFCYVDAKNNLTQIEYIQPQGSTVSERGGLRSVDTITEDETNNKVFAMNHRSIGFEANGNKGPLYAFSVGLPKDSRSIYIDIDFRIGEIREELSNKSPSKQ